VIGFILIFPLIYIPVINDVVFLHAPISWEVRFHNNISIFCHYADARTMLVGYSIHLWVNLPPRLGAI
jgi:hypothetical protein